MRNPKLRQTLSAILPRLLPINDLHQAILAYDPFQSPACVHLDLDDVGSILGLSIDTVDFQTWDRGSEQLHAVGSFRGWRHSRLAVVL